MKYFNVMHFLIVIIFKWRNFFGSLLFSGLALLTWFAKRSKLGEGFNDNEQLWSFSTSFHCLMLLSVSIQQAKTILLLDKEVKRKIVLRHSMHTRKLYLTKIFRFIPLIFTVNKYSPLRFPTFKFYINKFFFL